MPCLGAAFCLGCGHGGRRDRGKALPTGIPHGSASDVFTPVLENDVPQGLTEAQIVDLVIFPNMRP